MPHISLKYAAPFKNVKLHFWGKSIAAFALLVRKMKIYYVNAFYTFSLKKGLLAPISLENKKIVDFLWSSKRSANCKQFACIFLTKRQISQLRCDNLPRNSLPKKYCTLRVRDAHCVCWNTEKAPQSPGGLFWTYRLLQFASQLRCCREFHSLPACIAAICCAYLAHEAHHRRNLAAIDWIIHLQFHSISKTCRWL